MLLVILSLLLHDVVVRRAVISVYYHCLLECQVLGAVTDGRRLVDLAYGAPRVVS